MADGRLEKDKDILRKIFKRQNGLKALEEVLSEKDQAPAKQTVKELAKPIVAILIPSYGQPKPRMQMGVMDMRRHAEQEGACRTQAVPLMPNSVVHWQRNDLLCWLIKSEKPYTHVLFIDDDIVPPIDALGRLLAHNVDIVGALCTFRRDPPIPNARFYDEQTMRYAEMRDWSKDGLVEVDAVGTGMMLISVNALQKIADVWFQCAIERDVYKISDELAEQWSQNRVKAFDEVPNAQWFQFLPTPDGGVREFGEDISFCWKAKKYAGLKVWVDTSVNPEHLGEYGYTIADYKSQRRVMKERAEAEGRTAVPQAPVQDEEEIKVVG